MKKLEIDSGSTVGKLIGATEYKDFEKQIKRVGNIADVFVEVDAQINKKIEDGKAIKRDIDATLKPYRTSIGVIRNHTATYMQKNHIEKIEGIMSKSITFHSEKTIIETVAEKQILVGRKYTTLAELSFEDLVNMLEAKGVKTRTITKEVETTILQGIRVTK